MKNIALIIVFVLALCGQALAATVTATPENSSVMFSVIHDLGYTVGYFDDFTATLETGDGAGEIVSVKAQLATASVQTRNAVRDEGLKSALFFDAGKFPQATFESSKVEGHEISGTLTLKGVAKSVTFKIERLNGKMLLKGTINRNDFGVTYNKTLADKKKSIGEDVELIMEINGSSGGIAP